MHPVPASALLPGTLTGVVYRPLSRSLPPHLPLAGTPAVDRYWPASPPLLRWTVSQELAGWREGVFTGRRTCMQSTGSGQEEGALLTEPSQGLPGGYKTHQSTLLLFIKGRACSTCVRPVALLISLVCLPVCLRAPSAVRTVKQDIC